MTVYISIAALKEKIGNENTYDELHKVRYVGQTVGFLAPGLAITSLPSLSTAAAVRERGEDVLR